MDHNPDNIHESQASDHNPDNILESQASNYEHFCRTVGIWPMSNRDSSYGAMKRPAKNKGTYEQLVHSQRKCRSQYYTTASIINIALFAQLLIAAVVTAVSASDGPRLAITILGAINTVLAGSLTWVKGQGIPDRLIAYANELRRVREHIENLERQYEQRLDFRLDVESEAKNIYTMYDNARKSAENAYVGTFKSIKTSVLEHGRKNSGDAPQVPGDGAPAPADGAVIIPGANAGVGQSGAEQV